MLRNNTLWAAVALGLLASGSVAAQDATQLFAKESEYMDARLSPNGAYVAVTTPFEDRHALSLIKLSGNYERSVIKFDPKEVPYGQTWTDDERLVVFKAKDYGRFGTDRMATGDVYAANADGTGQTQLFGYLPDNNATRSRMKDEGWTELVDVDDAVDGKAIFAFHPWGVAASKPHTAVIRVDTKTGSRSQVDSVDGSVEVRIDNSGEPRFMWGDNLKGDQIVMYRAKHGGEWAIAPKGIAGKEILDVLGFEADNDHVYAYVSDAGEPAMLYRLSLSTGTREKLAGNAVFEPVPNDSRIEVGRAGFHGKPMIVSYQGGRPKIDYVDTSSEWVKLHAGLMKAFPGQLVDFVDFTRDNNTVLFRVHSDRHPGAYYLFDRRTNTPKLLFEQMEWIDPAKMAQVQPVEFKNRSGETLYGFYTAPAGRQGPLPLVVMPHGGPYDVTDAWEFNPDAQFLASLGYAVLQVNYRGSAARGEKFEDATVGQWGTGIQDDITDGLKFVISQGMADPKRVCIYGASFGGYSAMMNPIRNPGTYKCAIGYAGVYDLDAFYSQRDSTAQTRAFFGRTLGNRDEQSPVKQIAKLDVPFLMIHGKSDQTVPFGQFNIAQTALAGAGKTYETLAKADEGHGFFKEANRAEVYRRMKDFLLKYNPPN